LTGARGASGVKTPGGTHMDRLPAATEAGNG
jgi:hypothetical protein